MSEIDTSKPYKKGQDPETDAVLEEMEEDGLELPEFAKTPESEAKPIETEESQEEEAEEEPEEALEESEVTEENRPPRQTSAPRQKLEYWQKKARDLAEKVKELEEKDNAKEADEELQKIAQEENIPIERLTRLANTIAKKAQNPELQRQLREVAEYQKEQKFWESQSLRFDTEFNRTIVPLILRDKPNATQEDIDNAYADLDSKAWYGDNSGKSLISIYLQDSRPRTRVTGEPSRSRSISGKPAFRELTELTPEDIDEMSDEEFDQYSLDLAKRSPKLVGGNSRSL